MRVIAGTARRLQLKTLDGMDTRPTTDRIKETLFEAGISQTELAKRLGKGFNMVNLYATNRV